MKKVLLIVIMVLIMGVPTMAKQSPEKLMIGSYYNDALSMIGGAVIPLGGCYYALGYGQIGDYGGNVNAEMLVAIANGKFWCGPIIGPNYEIINNAEIPSTEVLLGAGGFVAGYWWNDYAGCWAGIKWKSDFQDEGPHKDTWTVGIGLMFDY